jgi:hypothetical protein
VSPAVGKVKIDGRRVFAPLTLQTKNPPLRLGCGLAKGLTLKQF